MQFLYSVLFCVLIVISSLCFFINRLKERMKFNFKYIILIVFVSCELLMSMPAFSQTKKLDSLQRLIEKSKEDTSKVFLIENKAREYLNQENTDSAFKYFTKEIILAKKILNSTSSTSQSSLTI